MHSSHGDVLVSLGFSQMNGWAGPIQVRVVVTMEGVKNELSNHKPAVISKSH